MWSGIGVAVMAVAFVLGMSQSYRLAEQVLIRNRSDWPNLEKSGRLSAPLLHALIAQIRDDMGGVYSVLCITNGLLAAIVGGMAFYLVR